MAIEKLFIANEKGLRVKYGQDINAATITFTNNDGSVYTASGFSTPTLKIHASAATRDTALVTNTSGLSFNAVTGVLTLTLVYTDDIGLDLGDYYFEIYFNSPTKELVRYGKFEVI